MAPRHNRPRYRKRYGQHHLRSADLCAPLVRWLAPAERRIVEIGPGGGVLTRALLAADADVVAMEVDLAWLLHIRAQPWARSPRLDLVAIDALRAPWHRLAPGTQVTGNLPFNVATPILEAVTKVPTVVPRAGFMVQKEVADRLLAPPGDKAYGALGVLVAARADVTLLGIVQPGSFVPPPKVAAAFIGLTMRPPPISETEMGEFEVFVRALFSRRRKTLRNALGAITTPDRASAALGELGIDPTRRAETLDLSMFLDLWRATRT